MNAPKDAAAEAMRDFKPLGKWYANKISEKFIQSRLLDSRDTAVKA